MIFSLIADFAAALAAMPEAHPRRRIVALLDEAIRRDVHFIDRHPTTLFQCLWNSCWWYDCPRVAEYHDAGSASNPPAAHPEEQRGEKLCGLLERWRTERVGGEFGRPWLRSLRPPRLPLGSPQRAVLRGHAGFVTCVACSLDGRLIASGSDDTTVRIWDTGSAREVWRFDADRSPLFRADARPVCDVTFSPTAPLVASGSQDGRVRVWDLTSGRMLWTSLADDPEAPNWVTVVGFAADGEHLWCHTSAPSTELCEAATGKRVKTWGGDECPGGQLQLSRDGRRLIGRARNDPRIQVWDVVAQRAVCTLDDEFHAMTPCALSPNGAWVLTRCPDGRIRVWDAETGRCRNAFVGRAYSPEVTLTGPMDISSDAHWLVMPGTGWSVETWDVWQGRRVQSFHGHAYGVRGVAILPEVDPTSGSPIVVSGAMDSTVRLWTAVGNTTPALEGDSTSFVMAVAYSPDGKYLASVNQDGNVRIWDARTARVLRELTLGKIQVYHLMFSRTGRHLYISTEFGVRVWRTMTRCPVRALRARKTARNQANASVAASNLWNQVWEKEMGPGLDREKVLGGWQSGVPGIPFGPFGVRREGTEMVVRTRAGAKEVAWHPEGLYENTWHPSGRIWCGRESNRLNMFTLEAEAEPAS